MTPARVPAGRRAARGRRGNAMVEFVLVLPLFLMLVLGAIDWGWYFAVREVVINATRQGARVGSAAPSLAAAQADARTAVRTYLARSLGAAYAVTPDVGPSACAGAGYQCITVSLTSFPTVPTRPDSSLSGLIAWTRVPARITAQAEMRLELQP